MVRAAASDGHDRHRPHPAQQQAQLRHQGSVSLELAPHDASRLAGLLVHVGGPPGQPA